jgi:hypothetical protein
VGLSVAESNEERTRRGTADGTPPARRRFFLGPGPFNTLQAREFCLANGGQLASLRSMDETYLIFNLKNRLSFNGLWLGVQRNSPNCSSTYRFEDGYVGSPIPWCEGEPQCDEVQGAIFNSPCLNDFAYSQFVVVGGFLTSGVILVFGQRLEPRARRTRAKKPISSICRFLPPSVDSCRLPFALVETILPVLRPTSHATT